MRVLVDTNVLLRISQTTSPDHSLATSSVSVLMHAGYALCIVPQVVYEYWVVATRPLSVNGLGMDIQDARRSVERVTERFQLLKDERGIYGEWESLVIRHTITGKLAHDARLVAAMLRHDISHVVTFNVADFARFPQIQVYSPADVLAGRLPK